jgi:hypothetical protein
LIEGSRTRAWVGSLREAGASEGKSRAAAESLVLSHDRLERIEGHTSRMPTIEHDVSRIADEAADLKVEIEPLTWLNGIVIVGVLALIIKTFFA